MDYKHLDEQFDQTLDRLEKKSGLPKDPYGNSPLASDHFLLKKSWDYFRMRARNFESEWKELLKAKEEQTRVMADKIRFLEERVHELDDENHMLRTLDEGTKRASSNEYLNFHRKTARVNEMREEERQIFQRKIDQLEFNLEQTKKEMKRRLDEAAMRENKLREAIESQRRDAAAAAEKEHLAAKDWADQISKKDDLAATFGTKVELLRGEVERRDMILKQLQEKIAEQGREMHLQLERQAEQMRTIKDKDQELFLLKSQLEILQRERENMRASWQREQAEWRELWDRGREAWERGRNKTQPF